jgi:ATP-dependent Clp protease ATP-binding subunit ClpB
MDPAKITAKVGEAINAARDLALEEGHQALAPLHVAVVMFDDAGGVARAAVSKAAGSEETLKACARQLRRALARLPKLEPAPDEVYVGPELKKAFAAAAKAQKARGDAFLAADVLLAAVAADKIVGAALAEAGFSPKQLETALEATRGERTVQSAEGDAAPEGALALYGIDLTARAGEGKLDPVIGRDDEIRRTIRILCRRTKNNPCLVGEPGVGKTAIAEGLALRIVKGDVPSTLAGEFRCVLDQPVEAENIMETKQPTK